MKIGIPKEVHPGEKRVATTPEVAAQLQKLGFSVAIEAGAGAEANFADSAYAEAGVEVVSDTRALWTDCDVLMKVRGPQTSPALNVDELELLHKGQVLISFLWPAQNQAMLDALAAKGLTAIAMDSIPRISRASISDGFSQVRLLPRARFRPPRCSSSAPASPVSRRSVRQRVWARSFERSTPAPKSRSR